MKKTSVLIIYTGGTIGMVRDHESGTLRPFNFSEIEEQVPELRKFGYQLKTISFDPVIDSSNTDPGFWVRLAETIQEHYDHHDGFVVLHGTDTMSYSASALSFMLENLAKPVVFTGSQLPIGTLRTDGRENLITAIEIAADQTNGVPVVPEVCIYFENKLFRGNRTTKHSADHFNAFISENYPPLAEAGIRINYNYSNIHYPVGDQPLIIHTNMSTGVFVIRLIPGIPLEAIRSVINTPGIRGIILESFGSGNAPTSPDFISVMKSAVEKDIIIYNVTQCNTGSIHMGQYETSRELLDMGVVSGFDITTEAAVTKMMFLLGQELSVAEVRERLEQSLRGEINA